MTNKQMIAKLQEVYDALLERHALLKRQRRNPQRREANALDHLWAAIGSLKQGDE